MSPSAADLLRPMNTEQLARAIHTTKGGGPFGREGECECLDDAKAIAAEYDRLTGSPSDDEVLDRARRHLGDARDWLNSDTSTAIGGRRSVETHAAIADALEAIGRAKAAIDRARG